MCIACAHQTNDSLPIAFVTIQLVGIWSRLHIIYSGTPLKRTPLGPNILSFIASVVSFVQGVFVDHAPLNVVANYNVMYDEARLWMMKPILKDLLIFSS